MLEDVFRHSFFSHLQANLILSVLGLIKSCVLAKLVTPKINAEDHQKWQSLGEMFRKGSPNLHLITTHEADINLEWFQVILIVWLSKTMDGDDEPLMFQSS